MSEHDGAALIENDDVALNDDDVPAASRKLSKTVSSKFRKAGSIGKGAVLNTSRDWRQRWKDRWATEAPNIVGIALWLAMNAGLSTWAIVYYWERPNSFVAGARFFGVPLNLNCAILLLTMLRNWLTWLRDSSQLISTYVPLDAAPVFHRIVGWTVAFQSVFHTFFHYLNLYVAAETTGLSLWTLGWSTMLLAMWTGHALCVIMFFMYVTSVERFRVGNFNTFFATHHLFIVFYCFLFAHAPEFWCYSIAAVALYVVERLLRELRSKNTRVIEQVRVHPSDVLEIRFRRGNFRYRAGQWLYLRAPAVSAMEWHPFTISSAPEDDTISIHIRCVGDWTRGLRELLVPDYKTCPMRTALTPPGRPVLHIDGPMGSASDLILKWKKGSVLMVAAGIGVTPFSSVLRSLHYRVRGVGNNRVVPSKFYFVWSTRDYEGFEWLRDELAQMEVDLNENGLADLLDISIFVTKRFDADSIAKLHHNTSLRDNDNDGVISNKDYQLRIDDDDRTRDDNGNDNDDDDDDSDDDGRRRVDALTGLSALTNYGRPNFPIIFSRLAEAHPHEKIGIFLCGPRVIQKTLQAQSLENTRTTSTRFVLHAEHF
jgi:predicted ferric reductase